MQGDQGAEYSGQDMSQIHGQISVNAGYQMVTSQSIDQNQNFYTKDNGNREKKRKIRDSPSRNSSEEGRARRRKNNSPSFSNDVS